MTALHVLHVDDEPDIREVVEMSLGLDADFETRSCGSGQEALDVAASWHPDLILLDVMMPGMDGPATLAHLRENAQTASIPVVFMTARAQTREIERFRSLGVVGVIPKPFDPMTLAASVREYVEPADHRLVALRKTFLRRINDDAMELAEYRSALNGAIPPAALSGIRDIAHGLAGASGIFGFPEVGDAASALEDVIVQYDGSGSAEGVAHALDRLLDHLETCRTHGKELSHSRLDA